ncbi:MAG: hypothetical protein ACYSX1_12930, partial [Planctomycetota bacterium]
DYQRLAKVDMEQRLYQITTISIDAPLDEEWTHVRKTLGARDDYLYEIRELITSIGDDKLYRFLRLEVEDTPEFEAFVFKETGRDENELYVEDFNSWRVLAMRFVGITKRADRVPFKRKVLKELGMWRKSRMSKTAEAKS